jgi:hypothetical protein
MHEFRMVYEEIGANIVHFLKLYRLSKDAHMNHDKLLIFFKLQLMTYNQLNRDIKNYKEI